MKHIVSLFSPVIPEADRGLKVDSPRVTFVINPAAAAGDLSQSHGHLPAPAGHQHPSSSTKSYCLVTEEQVAFKVAAQQWPTGV